MGNGAGIETDVGLTTIQFINSTNSHIFLTGKAGTGKTTFLKNLTGRTHKQFAIVAPTGIAALNAGGVTIHSQFLLPHGMFIPTGQGADNFGGGGNFYNADALARHHPLNSARRQVLRCIDLLVIDEVSMLRCDLLDAIDYRLKSVRSNFSQSFGGVQVLFIGDLYQLPPVVKQDEQAILKRYYNSPWFFQANALREDGFVYIELDKIFRQHDDNFITILNNLRNNTPTRADIDILNKYHKSAEEIERMDDVIITLTTHNYKADELNQQALKALDTPARFLHASVDGDFPESMFPVQQPLELKVGAQIMFIKNDTESKMYFNGKLATVLSISGDDVNVELAGTKEKYTLKKEVWENKRYSIDPETRELSEEVLGSFEQYPVKLAWAITVHKSQGLTFDRAIIDVGKAFADGQVYVALSRLRSLDGLVLRTKIDPNVISTDREIVTFTSGSNQPDTLPLLLKTNQRSYILRLIEATFEFERISTLNKYIQRSQHDSLTMDGATPVLQQLATAFETEKDNTAKFRRQLHSLLEQNSYPQLLERLKRGSNYYKEFLWKQVRLLLIHIKDVDGKKGTKSYMTSLMDLDLVFTKKLEELDKVVHLAECIIEDRDQYDFSQSRHQRQTLRDHLILEIGSKAKLGVESKKGKKRSNRRKKDKGAEPSTYDITLKLLQSGKTVPAIAIERGLTTGTIESHLARIIEQGRVNIYDFMSHETVSTIENMLKEMPEGFTSADLFAKLKGKFSFGQLKAVMNHTALKNAAIGSEEPEG